MERLKKGVVFSLLFLIWFFHGSTALAEMETVFSTEGSIQESILKEMESATSSVDLAIHEITSLDMAEALVKAKQRGVKMRIVADSKRAKLKTSQISYLIHQGIPVKVLGGKERGMMNYRFVVLDGKRVLTGTFDWFGTADKGNYESLLIVNEGEVVAAFQKEFEKLWREKRVIQ